jgi:hypothetical protein
MQIITYILIVLLIFFTLYLFCYSFIRYILTGTIRDKTQESLLENN